MFAWNILSRRLASATSDEGFSFLDPGVLVDGELELVAPHKRWVDDLLTGCRHPLTRALDPEHSELSRSWLASFLDRNPLGHEPARPPDDPVPVYHFWMRLRPEFDPPLPMAGTISLRIGHTADLELYYGHIGYNVYPAARGRHYAERACRLLLPLSRAHGLRPLWITTDPPNLPSRRTCERLGATLVDIVDVPEGHALRSRGQVRKCRYRLGLG